MFWPRVGRIRRAGAQYASGRARPPLVPVAEKGTAESISIPSVIETVDQLEALIQSLEAHRYGIGVGKSLNLSIER